MNATEKSRHVEQFSYSRQLQKGEIRLLDLSHSSSKGPKLQHECGIRTYRLEGAPPYYALSYVWGDATKTREVLLEGRPTALLESAYQALSQIQLHSQQGQLKSMPLWIDAACINQTDLQERSEQVQQMGRIYHQAQAVLIALGEAEPGYEKALSTITEGYNRLLDVSKTHGRLAADTLELAHYVLKRPWFSRLWVLQEAALAQQAWIMYGDDICDLRDLVNIKNIWTLDFSRLSAGHRPQSHLFNMPALHHLGQIPAMAHSSLPFSQKLAVFMSIGRTRFCQDPRDHVYGLLGLVNHNSAVTSAPLDVDYSKSVSDVFIEATRMVLPSQLEEEEGYSGLNWLAALHGEFRERMSSDTSALLYYLPSWVPNWASQSPDSASMLYVQLYNAGSGDAIDLDHQPSIFSTHKRWLTLRGFVFTSVEHVEPGLDEMADHQHRSNMCSRVLMHHSDAEFPYGDRKGRQYAFLRTICTDTKLKMKADSSLSRWAAGDAELFWEQWFDTDTEFVDHEWYPRTRCLPEDAFLVSESGHFGLGRAAAQPGDLVVVFPHVRVPFVLRKRPSTDRYQMIGPAYVDGIMDGEAMSGLQDGKYELQTFIVD